MQLIVSLVMGGLIGVAHSWLAIKLFFWPRRAYYVFGCRIPMTPGVFVANKQRFATQLAAMLLDQFLGPAGVQRALGQALESGAVRKAISEEVLVEPNAIKATALNFLRKKIDGLSPADIASISGKVSKGIRKSGAVDKAVRESMAEMSPEMAEAMVMGVIHKELQFIIYLGFPLGAVVIVIHELWSGIWSLIWA